MIEWVVITWIVLLKLEPTSDVLGKDFRCDGDTVESVDDKPLRKRIELLSAFAIVAFFAVSVAVDDELEL